MQLLQTRRGMRHLAVSGVLLVAFCLLLTAPVRAEGPTIVADHSLTPKQYADLGLPAIDKPWTADDYTKAAKVLEDLLQKDPTQLPRLNSPQSGVVFDRFVAAENIPSTTDNSTPAAQRLSSAGKLLTSSVRMFYAYAKKTTAGECYDREALKMGAYLLRMEIATAILGDQTLASSPAGSNPAAAEGVTQIKNGIVQSASGLLEMMCDHDSVRSTEAVAYAKELKELFAKAYPELLPDGKVKMHQQLTDAIGNETDANIKAALTDLLKSLPEK